MLTRHLNSYHPDFKQFAKIVTPDAVAIIAASLIGKVNCSDSEGRASYKRRDKPTNHRERCCRQRV